MRQFITLLILLLSVSFVSAESAESRVIESSVLKGEVVSALKRKSLDNGYDLLVKSVSGLSDISLPEGRIEFEVAAPDSFSSKRVTASLIIRVEGVVAKNIPVVCEVEEWGDFVVASRQIEKGELITPDMLAVDHRVKNRSLERNQITIEESAGKKAARRIRKGEQLSSRDILKVNIIKPGQIVTIVAENELIRLTATGKTRGGGAVGDIVTVQNLSSNRDLTAKIVDERTVKVDF